MFFIFLDGFLSQILNLYEFPSIFCYSTLVQSLPTLYIFQIIYTGTFLDPQEPSTNPLVL
jgi:hypothetical protein